jgi:hypothetical protein
MAQGRRFGVGARAWRGTLSYWTATVAAAIAGAQQSAMIFDTPETVGDGNTRIVDVGDTDGDGDLDLLSAGTAAGFVHFGSIRNEGAAGWATGPTLVLPLTPVVPPAASTLFVRSSDFDGDGDVDFVYANNAGVAGLSSGPPGQAPTVAWFLFESSAVLGLVVLDFDADGLDDFVVATAAELRLYRSSGAGAPTLASATVLTGYSRWSLATIDWDGAPPLDVVALGTIASSSASVVRAYPIAATGAFGAASVFAISAADGSPVFVGDADGDGDDDLATSDGSGMRLLRRTGAATFVVEAPLELVSAGRFYDMNGDGTPDMVSAGGTTPGVYLRVSVNLANLLFLATEQWMRALGADAGVHIADLDGDGDDDFAFGRGVAYGGRTQREQNLGYQGVTARRVLDLEGDGDPDLVLQQLSGQSSPLMTVPNDGTGKFPTSGAYLTAPFYDGGMPIDFDGDGRLDVLTANVALRNLGGGTFEILGPAISASHFMTAIGGSPTLQTADNSASADLDGDDDLDLVVRFPYSNAPTSLGFAVWWNLGGGQFAPGPAFPQREFFGFVDADGDGLVDLATYRHLAGNNLAGGAGELRVWRNLGGSFVVDDQPGAWPPLDASVLVTRPPSFGDLDDDGDPDAIVFGPSSARLLVNLGGGAFATLAQYPEYAPQLSGPFYIGGGGRLADVDDDGLTDVVFFGAQADIGGVSILKRTGPATFATPVRQALEPTALVDADGDGDLDAFGSSRLWRNVTYAAPTGGSRRQYGSGDSGTLGRIPRLGATGPFRAGESVRLVAVHGSGGQSGALVVGSASFATFFFGYPLLVAPELSIPLTLVDGPGPGPEGDWSTTFEVPAWFAGGALYFQVWTTDPAGPMSLACSNGLEIKFGG